jgi:hypothetical protein
MTCTRDVMTGSSSPNAATGEQPYSIHDPFKQCANRNHERNRLLIVTCNKAKCLIDMPSRAESMADS